MDQADYLQIIGGHCYICHNDYERGNHICKVGVATSCSENCSKKYTKINKNYKYCPYCGEELK